MATTDLSDGWVVSARGLAQQTEMVKSQVALLTGGGDRPYALGLAGALTAKGVCLDFIGSEHLDSLELRNNPKLTFLNLRGNHTEDASLARKVSRVLMYYARLIQYASGAGPKVFHILWNNKLQLFDRTVLMLYYKLRGKRVALTAHNVNAGRRDLNDSFLNRLTLKVQYRLADHIFVHTEAMKRELLEGFGVRDGAITVIPFGINNSVPQTDVTPGQAKQRLGIGDSGRTILFFGNIGPYKGVEFLVAAFQQIAARDPHYRLIIAGRPRPGCKEYLNEIRRAIGRDGSRERVMQRIEYIPDEETELYFKAADVLVLPYTQVSQSGVLVLGYSFGLPVIAADVGSFREDIIEGRTGFLCRPCDPVDLARTIEAYFQSDLFKTLDSRRQEIRDYACERYSWDVVSQATRRVYEELLAH
jgi:glycosyltransferase involved in cell wall biosynthesis